MYIYQDGKLYVQIEDKLVGVNISPNKTSILEKETTVLSPTAIYLTADEVGAKFGIKNDEEYIFPVTKKVVKKDDTVGKTKTTPKRSSRGK